MNNSSYDVNAVIQIIHRLHGTSGAPPSLEEQKQLQNALFAAQQAPEAWTLGGQLLSGADKDVNVRFFGAHTLTVKISRDWATLAEEHWTGLKDAMLAWLAESASTSYPPPGTASRAGERIVLRKLTVAVTGLSFRLIPNAWPNWLLETMMRISGSGCSKTGIYEVLTTVIEDVARADLVGSKRAQYDQVIADVAPLVAQTITESLTSPQDKDVAELNAALKCLQSWISSRNLNRDLLSNIYPLVLQLLPNEPTCVAACACTEDIVLDISFATESRVSPLLDFCASNDVGQIFAQAQQEGEMEEVPLALVKLVVALLEHSYTVVVASLTTPRSITLLQRLLLITCFPGYFGSDETVSDVGLPIWSYLQEEISDNGIVATESGFGDARWTTVKEVFEALVSGLRGKVEYPTHEAYRNWPKDVKQGFVHYRADVGDCLINAFYVLRNAMLGDLVARTNNLLSQPRQHPNTTNEPLEATLFCISAIQEAVPEDEDSFLPMLFGGSLFTAYPQFVGSGNERLRTTILHLIEVYAPWFKTDSTHLLPAVETAVSSLTSSATCQAAARALSALCDSCRKDLTPHVASFAELVRNLEGQIPNEDYVRVVGSVAAVIQALPADELVRPVVVLVETSIAKLASALTGPSASEARPICLLQLASLTACAKALAEPEDEILDLDGLAEATDEAAKSRDVLSNSRVEQLRSHLLEATKALTTSFRGDYEVAQALSDFLKACTSTNISTPLSLNAAELSDIVSYLVERDLESTWLSIGALLLFRLGKQTLSDPEKSMLQGVIARMLQTGINGLQREGGMENNPDIVQSFMDWALAALTSFVAILITLPQLVEGLLVLSIRGLDLQERVGLQKTIQLLTAITNEASNERDQSTSSLFKPLMQTHGRSALARTLAGIAGKLPRSNLSYLAELLLAFSRRMPNETRAWLKELFAEPGFPSERVSQEQKDRYGKTIMSARSLRKLREATEQFAIVCRGLEGTSYGTG